MSHKQQIAEARQRMASKFWTGGSIKALPKVLQSQEAVLEMASASFNDGQGIAVLTTHRVFGLRAGLTGRELEERPAETITAVHSKRGLINSSLTIESLTGSLTFSSMVAEDATRLETRIRTALAWQGPPEPYAAGTDFDPYGALPTGSSMTHPEAAERLRSLRDLYDQGLLMESEYQAKRAEIIAQL